MSGSVAEALLGGSGGGTSNTKKVPLLPPPPKVNKKEPKTYCFNLKLPESNEQTYPEFSWAELVRNAKQKEITKKAGRGNAVLDPYASDDEEDLKAMAAKFEAKYNSAVPPKKKKRRAEDLLDRGAGYDETDPFIDNSDIYDEVVPVDLQTKHGGFYINSGSLDFKELDISEDDEDSSSQAAKDNKVNKPKDKDKHSLPIKTVENAQPKIKNPVGRPPGSQNKTSLPGDKVKVQKKRKLIISPIGGPDGKQIVKSSLNSNSETQNKLVKPPQDLIQKPKGSAKPIQLSSSSSSSSGSSSSSTDTSASSASDSDSSTEEKEKPKESKTLLPVKPKLHKPIAKPADPSMKSFASGNAPRPVDMLSSAVSSNPSTAPPLKRIKTKNVPLNPKLHPNLAASINNPSTTPVQMKSVNKDLHKPNGSSLNFLTSPRVQSPQIPAAMSTSSTPSPSMKPPTPKNNLPSSNSAGLSISPVTGSGAKLATPPNTSIKQKATPKQAPTVSPSHLTAYELLQSINNYSPLPSLTSPLTFPTPINHNSSLLKSPAMNMITQKNLPHLKKLSQPTEKLDKAQQQKQSKPKMVKKTKAPSSNLTATPPTSLNSSNLTHSFLSAFKGPPPLGGPGVEMSKNRTPNPHVLSSGGAGSAIKSISNPRSVSTSSANPILLNPISIANLTSAANQISTLASSYSSMLNSTPTSLVNSIPSSLTVQRLTQSVTISPTSNSSFMGSNDRTSVNHSRGSLQSSPYTVGATDIRPVKHNSAFDVSALLQGSVTSFPNSSVINIGSSSGTKTGKATNNIDRDIASRKQ